MGKKQNTSENIISQKGEKKAKELAEKLKQKQQEEEASKAEQIQESSKKIKKEKVQPKSDEKKKKKAIEKKPKLKKEKEEVQANIETLDVNRYADFVKTETLKYLKIRKRTIEKLQIDKNQVKKAVKALITHYQNQQSKSNNLLATGDDFIYLEIVMSQVPEKYSIRPIQIPLPTPIYGPEHQSKFCIFSRDPQRAYKDKIQDLNIPSIAKVIGYSKLVKKYPQYSDRRKLIYEYDLFFCDYTLYNLLRKPTGKIFYERKKIPYPIDCNGVPAHLQDKYKTYEEYLNSLGNFTYFIMGNGPVYTVKVARTTMSLKESVKNIIHGIYNTVPHILRESIKHTKVRQISIKTADSISLPIFNQLTPEEINSFIEEEN